MEKFNTPQKGCTYIHIQTDILIKRIFGGGGGGSLRGFEISFDLLFAFVEHLKKLCIVTLFCKTVKATNF